jgi:hypothetical protein
MTTFKTEQADWNSWMQEEHNLDEYREKFGIKMTRENICDTVKSIMMKSYLLDLSEACITRQ